MCAFALVFYSISISKEFSECFEGFLGGFNRFYVFKCSKGLHFVAKSDVWPPGTVVLAAFIKGTVIVSHLTAVSVSNLIICRMRLRPFPGALALFLLFSLLFIEVFSGSMSKNCLANRPYNFKLLRFLRRSPIAILLIGVWIDKVKIMENELSGHIKAPPHFFALSVLFLLDFLQLRNVLVLRHPISNPRCLADFLHAVKGVGKSPLF